MIAEGCHYARAESFRSGCQSTLFLGLVEKTFEPIIA